MPHGHGCHVDALKTRVSETRFTKSETESKNLIFKCGQKLHMGWSCLFPIRFGHVPSCFVWSSLLGFKEYLTDSSLNNSHRTSLNSHRTSLNSHTTLINSHTHSAAKHCSSLNSHTSTTFIVVSLSHSPSHSHTISTVHLHILMSGKGLLTL